MSACERSQVLPLLGSALCSACCVPDPSAGVKRSHRLCHSLRSTLSKWRPLQGGPHIDATTYLDAIFLPSSNFRVDPHNELLVFFAPHLDSSSALSNTHFSAIRYTPDVRFSFDF